MKETNKVYKLATLYMLSKVETPISTNRLSFFLLKNNYTDYFTFAQGLGELISDGWVDTVELHGKTMYQITPEGLKALSLLSKEISDSMKKDIESYLKENKLAVREDFSIKARSYQYDIEQYISELSIEEAGKNILEIRLSSSTQEASERICTNWKKSSEEVYPMLIEMLMR